MSLPDVFEACDRINIDLEEAVLDDAVAFQAGPDGTRVASWSADDNATSYTVSFTVDGVPYGGSISVTSTEIAPPPPDAVGTDCVTVVGQTPCGTTVPKRGCFTLGLVDVSVTTECDSRLVAVGLTNTRTPLATIPWCLCAPSEIRVR